MHITVLTGASRGLGLAMAQQLLAPDRLLLCLSRSTHPELQAQADALGAPLLQWSADLVDGEAVAARLAQWLDEQNQAEVGSATLINNAGVIPAVAPLEAVPPTQVAHALRVGLEAPLLLTGAFLGATSRWVEQGWRGPRRVLNISSGLGRHPMASQAPYCAAKAGLDHFTRCAALDQAQQPHGAKLVSLAPGVIDTDMQVQLRGAETSAFPDRERFVELLRSGVLTSPQQAAARVLAWLDRPDFGRQPVADVRDA
ncbi:MAG: short-chain dehydrogenase [Comamonadaceae bacterium]|jgi:NAD(P)-dependent dehydrogenase (short-subunit alcohol dehydrogenase family)|nr:short-chain dehydrogenase [Comamonadaceae bacterium]